MDEYINFRLAKFISLQIQGNYILNNRNCIKVCNYNTTQLDSDLSLCYDHCMITTYCRYLLFVVKSFFVLLLGYNIIFRRSVNWAIIYAWVIYLL